MRLPPVVKRVALLQCHKECVVAYVQLLIAQMGHSSLSLRVHYEPLSLSIRHFPAACSETEYTV